MQVGEEEGRNYGKRNMSGILPYTGLPSQNGRTQYRRNPRIKNVSYPIAKAMAFGICMGKSQNLGTLVCVGVSNTQVHSFHMGLSYPRVSMVCECQPLPVSVTCAFSRNFGLGMWGCLVG